MLIDSGSTHTFIDYKLAKFINCCVYLAPKFHVMIANAGNINYSRMYPIIKLNMWEYLLDIPMIAIQRGGIRVVLKVQLLQSMGIMMTLNFLSFHKIFFSENKEIELRVVQVKQLCSLDVQTSISSTPLEHEKVINNHSMLSREIPKGLALARDLDHVIHF